MVTGRRELFLTFDLLFNREWLLEDENYSWPLTFYLTGSGYWKTRTILDLWPFYLTGSGYWNIGNIMSCKNTQNGRKNHQTLVWTQVPRCYAINSIPPHDHPLCLPWQLNLHISFLITWKVSVSNICKRQ